MRETLIKTKKSNNYSDVNYQPKQDKSFGFIMLAVLAFFVGFGCILGFYYVTLIDFYGLTKFMALFGVLGFLIPLKFYRKWFHFIKYEMIVFNILGLMPFLTGLFLVLNFVFSSDSTTKEYKIEKVYFEGEGMHKTPGIILEDNIFSGERKIVEIKDIELIGFDEKTYFSVTIAEGLFGYQVVKNREFVRKN